MIREMIHEDRNEINEMQFELQRFFSEIDQTRESLLYQSINDAHHYMQKIKRNITYSDHTSDS